MPCLAKLGPQDPIHAEWDLEHPLNSVTSLSFSSLSDPKTPD